MLTPDWPQVDSVRVMRMNLPEWPYILLGLLGSIVMGGAMPVYAILFGEVIHPHIYISTILHIHTSTHLHICLSTYLFIYISIPLSTKVPLLISHCRCWGC